VNRNVQDQILRPVISAPYHEVVTPRLLRSFVVLASELHFGRAAQRLLIAQPALSQQINTLEHDLGVKLFDRSRRHVALTPAGRVLLEYATDLLTRTGKAIEATQLAARGLTGRVRIAHTRSVPSGVARAIIELYDAIRRLVWGTSGPEVVREEPDEAHMLRAVAEGVGLAVCVASAVEPVNVAGLVVRRFEPPEPAVPLALAHRRDNDHPLLLRLTALSRRLSG
jgi:DNA-binding transcriptional LysR family regulator